MKQSQLFFRTLKEAPKDETSLNARLLIRAGYIDKLMAGAYTIMPLGYRVLKKIEQIIREEMNAIEGQEMVMPSLHPKENWEKTNRWDTLDSLIKVGFDDDKNMALGPTHEEVVSPLAKKIIFSYRDLPKAVYQFQNKFRMEKRSKSGLLRGREFIMKDLYSFHTDQSDLDAYYEKAKDAYIRIFSRAGIGETTYFTYASGGTFSKYSHEFQTLTSAGEDLIYICEHCHVAVNREIIDDLDHKCPECGNANLREDKAVEVGNIFKLGTKYSVPFYLTYKDQEGNDQTVIMGCYGIGLQRLMGTIVEVCNDENGIVWPEKVAPFAVHIVSLSDDAAVLAEAEKLHKELTEKGIEVLWDDRAEMSAGEKFSQSDLLGIPNRIVVSKKTVAEGKYEIKKRSESVAQLISKEELISMI